VYKRQKQRFSFKTLVIVLSEGEVTATDPF